MWSSITPPCTPGGKSRPRRPAAAAWRSCSHSAGSSSPRGRSGRPCWRCSRAGSSPRSRPGGRPRRPAIRAGRRTGSPCRCSPGGSSSPSKRTKRISRWSSGSSARERPRQLDHRGGPGGAVVGADESLRVPLGVVVGADQDRRGRARAGRRRCSGALLRPTARERLECAVGQHRRGARVGEPRSCAEPAGRCPTATCSAISDTRGRRRSGSPTDGVVAAAAPATAESAKRDESRAEKRRRR